MRQFNIINNITGWGVFIVALITYVLTLEPTASWWDCSEFIISAYKLEVGHPPGAPIHMILGRFFALFAGDTSNVAFMVNLLSALASAGTVMLLYLTIVHMAKKLFLSGILNITRQLIVCGSGLTGALAFAFTDSFWFSAVEGEVYALSSFFTAAVFWAILKWENVADEKYANRWLIFIAYLTGLSTGVHLLNLLAIPAIGLVYYFRKYEFSWEGFFYALFISALILAGIQYVIIPGLPRLAFLFDKLFVNGFGLPFNSGVLFLVFLIVIVSVWAVRYTIRKNLVMWNTVVNSVIVILLGYSSFALILIRADANPPMNQNHPDNAFSLLRYLNREQYGDRPLFYGPYYNAPAIAAKGEKKLFNKVDDKYVVTGTTPAGTVYEKELQTVFPRMYSKNPSHIDAYKEWGRVEGIPVRIRGQGKTETVMKPKFSENLRFFFTYQLGYMYFRYFMWNFAGRQNDIQGHGNFLNGNWISGIDFLDKWRTGPHEKLPGFMKNQPSKNRYYFLPLIFGLAGMFYQYNKGRKGKQSFIVIMTLFIFTGIAIIVYLNQTPIQPRERDYAYAGSFYAFAIWTGLAVPAIFSVTKKIIKGIPGAVLVIITSIILVPGILLTENLDDHDRSGRYMTRDYAINYLESCAPNAILFTYGDNDTFPLWYVQEVEGVRPDIKIINMSYLGMDWYISQHLIASNKAAPIPFSFDEHQYYTGTRDAVLFRDRIEDPVSLAEAMKFLGSDDERTRIKMRNGQLLDYFPSKNFYIPVDKQKVIQNGTVQHKDSSLIADRVEFSIDKEYITKSEMAVLNIIAANDWDRPVYVVHSLLHTGNIFFTEWLQFEGLAYRFVPVKTKPGNLYSGHVNTDILYDNVMNKFVWGNVNNPDVYLDDYNKREIKIIQARFMFARLAEELVNEGEKVKATEVVDKMFELFPDERIPLSFDSFPATEQYFRAGEYEKGKDKVIKMANNSFALLDYYLSLPERFAVVVEDLQERELAHIQNMLTLSRKYNQKDLYSEIDGRLKDLIGRLSKEIGY